MEATSTLVYNSTLAAPISQDAETSSSLRGTKARGQQEGRYEKEGKRWLRRRDNSQFVGNRHIVKPSKKDFELPYSRPQTTFPNPLPSFLPRHASIAPTSIPTRDPVSANAGRYSLSLKGVRRELRKGGPNVERIVLDIEHELVEWLTAGGVVLEPDAQHEVPFSRTLGEPLGASQLIREIRRSPMELVWRVDSDFPRFLLHCVARFHNIVSYSDDVRLTHLLRPNVTRPDFLAAKSLDTPPPSDMDAISNIADTDESDMDAGPELAPLSEEGEPQMFALQSVPEKRNTLDTSVGRVYQPDGSLKHQPHPQDEAYEASIDGTDDDEALSASVGSIALASSSRDWERTPRRLEPRAVSSPSRSPSRPARRTPRRMPHAAMAPQSQSLTFWHYVYG
ncbi:hypothetical protein BU17DRAFT_52777 [Hysterangium stoloniferum]|nr:hypothetical protein BU17DRAFT_52777 [Hysterangium stoloniferum]